MLGDVITQKTNAHLQWPATRRDTAKPSPDCSSGTSANNLAAQDEKEPPGVVLNIEPPTPEELAQMIAKRDTILREMGYLPPDEDHEYWHKPSEDDGKSKKQGEH